MYTYIIHHAELILVHIVVASLGPGDVEQRRWTGTVGDHCRAGNVGEPLAGLEGRSGGAGDRIQHPGWRELGVAAVAFWDQASGDGNHCGLEYHLRLNLKN